MSTAEIVPRVEAWLPEMNSDQARGAMNACQSIMGAMLDPADWIGTPGEPDSFVKRSGWLKIATAYGLSTEITGQRIDRDDDDAPKRAHATVRATNRAGRFADGDGGCGINEPRFRSTGGRQKLEHDLIATAVTRATNRAISNLVGFGQVSAEEVDADVRAGASAAAELPAWAAYASDSDVMSAASQLVDIVQSAGADPAGVTKIGANIRERCGGGIPVCVVEIIAAINAALGSAPAMQPTQEWLGDSGNGGEQR